MADLIADSIASYLVGRPFHRELAVPRKTIAAINAGFEELESLTREHAQLLNDSATVVPWKQPIFTFLQREERAMWRVTQPHSAGTVAEQIGAATNTRRS